MKLKKFIILTTLAIAAFLLSACGGNVGTATSWPGLSTDGENAFLAFNQFVYSVNLSNGLEKWRFPLEGKSQVNYFAAPTLSPDGQQLIFGDYNNILHSVDPSTGTEKWSFSDASDRYVSSALATEELIYAPNAGNHMYALDQNGNFQWSFESGGPLWAKPVTETSCKCIYIPSMDHHLYAVDAGTGELKWKSAESLGGSLVGTPALSPEGVLYVGTFGSRLIAIDSNNGKTLWSTPTNDWVWGGPILQGDTLYSGDLSGTLYAVDAATGAIKWQKTPDGPITESPLVTEDSIYIATETGGLLAFDLDGNARWTKTFEGGKLHTSPVQAGDKILVTVTGTPELLFAFDQDGNQIWAFTPEPKK